MSSMEGRIILTEAEVGALSSLLAISLLRSPSRIPDSQR